MNSRWRNFPPGLKEIIDGLDEDASSFESFMNKVFSETMPSSFFPAVFKQNEQEQHHKKKQEKLDYQVFDLHDFVIVQIPIKGNAQEREARFFHTSSQLTVEGIPNKGDRHVIRLPALVQHKKTKAKIKDNLLEISMRKVQDYCFTHIDVRWN